MLNSEGSSRVREGDPKRVYLTLSKPMSRLLAFPFQTELNTSPKTFSFFFYLFPLRDFLLRPNGKPNFKSLRKTLPPSKSSAVGLLVFNPSVGHLNCNVFNVLPKSNDKLSGSKKKSRETSLVCPSRI